jgi:hypothetical protein
MADPTEIDMDEIVRLVRAEGVEVYVEQTGGGCATIFAGGLVDYPVPDSTEHEQRYGCAAGPGWFDGPGWTNARGSLDDFHVGPDDYGEGDAYAAVPDDNETTLAARIVAEVRKR